MFRLDDAPGTLRGVVLIAMINPPAVWRRLVDDQPEHVPHMVAARETAEIESELKELKTATRIDGGHGPLITWGVFGAELQRDWARTDTVPAGAQIMFDHWGNVGTSLQWEQQLLNSAKAVKAGV